jgi:hypothetical protein
MATWSCEDNYSWIIFEDINVLKKSFHPNDFFSCNSNVTMYYNQVMLATIEAYYIYPMK